MASCKEGTIAIEIEKKELCYTYPVKSGENVLFGIFLLLGEVHVHAHYIWFSISFSDGVKRIEVWSISW